VCLDGKLRTKGSTLAQAPALPVFRHARVGARAGRPPRPSGAPSSCLYKRRWPRSTSTHRTAGNRARQIVDRRMKVNVSRGLRGERSERTRLHQRRSFLRSICSCWRPRPSWPRRPRPTAATTRATRPSSTAGRPILPFMRKSACPASLSPPSPLPST